MNLKVQIIKDLTSNSLLNSGFDIEGKLVTFIAYSDEMKARILEQQALGVKFIIKPTADPIRPGEWLEKAMVSSEL